MPPISDPGRLTAYKDALRNWNVGGYVLFDLTTQAQRRIQRELGLKEKHIRRLMHEFVVAGGEIDEIAETRPEWTNDWEFHHDLRVLIQGRRVYKETRLMYQLPVVPDDARIQVVNVHECESRSATQIPVPHRRGIPVAMLPMRPRSGLYDNNPLRRGGSSRRPGPLVHRPGA